MTDRRALSAKLDRLERQLSAQEAKEGERLIDEAIRRGAFTHDSRDSLIRLFESAPAETRRIIENRPGNAAVALENSQVLDPEEVRAFEAYFERTFGFKPLLGAES